MKKNPNNPACNDDMDSEGDFVTSIHPLLLSIARTFHDNQLVDDLVQYMLEKLVQSGKLQNRLWLYRRAVDYMRKEHPIPDRRRMRKLSYERMIEDGWQVDNNLKVYDPEEYDPEKGKLS